MPELSKTPPYPGSAALLAVMKAAADAIDYGVAVVAEDAAVLFCNLAAQRELRRAAVLTLRNGRICPCDAACQADLQLAIDAAVRRTRRSWLTFGVPTAALSVAVVPLPVASREDELCVLLLLGRRQTCAPLSAEGYARQHRLTSAECAVLRLLSEGHAPREIASRHGVSIATVRTQIKSIRDKTGTRGITDIVARVASLPPVALALGA